MELKEINSLVELFFKKYDEKFPAASTKTHEETFLVSLKNKDLPDTNSGPFTYSWENINTKIKILSNYLEKIISKGDRCVLLSENRPEWLISDISIMNAGGVTVPLFTTYSESDYEYIINNCEPKVCIVSNSFQFKKIKNHIKENTIVISIDEFDKKIEFFKNIFSKAQWSIKTLNESIKFYGAVESSKEEDSYVKIANGFEFLGQIDERTDNAAYVDQFDLFLPLFYLSLLF